MPENALPCRNIAIRVDKPTYHGVIVAGIEPVPAGFGVIEITAVSKRVKVSDVACVCGNINSIAVCNRCNNTPLVVGVASDKCARCIGNADNVILCVTDVIIAVAVYAYRTDASIRFGVEVLKPVNRSIVRKTKRTIGYTFCYTVIGHDDEYILPNRIVFQFVREHYHVSVPESFGIQSGCVISLGDFF